MPFHSLGPFAHVFLLLLVVSRSIVWGMSLTDVLKDFAPLPDAEFLYFVEASDSKAK
jgi:hypothetical protein